MRKIYSFLLMLFLSVTGFSQIIAWDFNGAAGDETTIAATTLNSNLNSSMISRGPGINANSLANSYSSTGFTSSGTITDAVNDGEYFQFTINPQPGLTVSLSTLDANFRRSGTGPNEFEWQYSLDGFTTAGINIGSSISYISTTTNGDAQTQIDLSGITALQNVDNSTTITIRLYGYGASSTAGTFAIGRLAGNDLAVGGTITSSGPCSGAPSGQAGFGTITMTDVTASIPLVAGSGGTGRVVKMSTTNSFTDMVDGDDPTANTVFTTDDQVIFNGTGTGPVDVTGLSASTTYYLAIYEYNCASGRFYLNPPATSSFTTNAPPVLGLQLAANSGTYTIDFDNTLANVNNGAFVGGFSSTPVAGQLNSNAWAVTGLSDGNLDFGQTNTSGDYSRGPSLGAETTGGIYSFETSTGNNSLGVQSSVADWTPGTFTLRLQNKTGALLTELALSYTVYVFNDQNISSSFNLSYSTNGTTFTDVPALNVTSPEAGDGTPAWMANSRNTSITPLAVPVNGFVYLRWTGNDVSGSGSRDEFALDDIVIIPNPGQAPLPAELISFAGRKEGTKNILTWRTATEINSKGFEVQHSKNGENYTTLAFVPSQSSNGNSTLQLQYSYADLNPDGEKHYYRLRQLDYDGNSKLSNIVLVRGEQPVRVKLGGVFPNPGRDRVNVIVDARERDEVTLVVIDVRGKLLKQQVANVENGSNTLSLDISNLVRGTYLIKLVSHRNNEASNIVKFVKQ